MFSPFLKRVYTFTILMTVIGIIIFLSTKNNIETKDTILSIVNVYFKFVLPILIVYIIWKCIRDGFIGLNQILIMIINSIVYTILGIDILISIFYFISIMKI